MGLLGSILILFWTHPLNYQFKSPKVSFFGRNEGKTAWLVTFLLGLIYKVNYAIQITILIYFAWVKSKASSWGTVKQLGTGTYILLTA